MKTRWHLLNSQKKTSHGPLKRVRHFNFWTSFLFLLVISVPPLNLHLPFSLSPHLSYFFLSSFYKNFYASSFSYVLLAVLRCFLSFFFLLVFYVYSRHNHSNSDGFLFSFISITWENFTYTGYQYHHNISQTCDTFFSTVMKACLRVNPTNPAPLLSGKNIVFSLLISSTSFSPYFFLSCFRHVYDVHIILLNCISCLIIIKYFSLINLSQVDFYNSCKIFLTNNSISVNFYRV